MRKKIVAKAKPTINNLQLRQMARDALVSYLNGETWEVSSADVALRVLLTLPAADE